MEISIRQILCPTDFSMSARHAWQYALAVAARHGATVELLHVAESSAYAEDMEVGSESYEQRLHDRLRDLAAREGGDVSIQTAVISGVPYVEIVNRARQLSADMIVMGTHGRTGFKHFLIGSVTEKVVRTASCPVLTVRHPEHAITV